MSYAPQMRFAPLEMTSPDHRLRVTVIGMMMENPWTTATYPEGWYIDPITGKWQYKAPTPVGDDNGNAS